jgi:hypothetical protein
VACRGYPHSWSTFSMGKSVIWRLSTAHNAFIMYLKCIHGVFCVVGCVYSIW